MSVTADNGNGSTMAVLFGLVLGFLFALVQGEDPQHPPYLVSIQQIWYDYGDMRDHVCSGVIISPFWILTSGACVHPTMMRPPFPGYLVVAGTATIDGGDFRQEIGSDILRQYSYPGFDKYGTFEPNDIAIFQLDTPLAFNDHVRPVRLPKRGEVPTGDVVISGWGKDSNVSSSAVIPVIDYSECANDLDQIAEGDSQYLSATSNFCTGPLDGSTGSCFYDRGSPLVQDGILVGITSWGASQLSVKCGTDGVPSIYTEVSQFLDFIESYAVDLTWPPCGY